MYREDDIRNHFEKYNSNSSTEIALALAEDLGNMANAIFPKLNCDYFSKDDEQLLNFTYLLIAELEKKILEHLRNKGEL